MPRLFSGGVIHSEGPPGGSAAGLALRCCSVIIASAAPTFVPTGVVTQLAFLSVLWDPEGWANFTNNSILIPEPGLYQFYSFITWTPSGATNPHAGTFRSLIMDYPAPHQPLVRTDDPIQLMADGQCQERGGNRFLFVGQAVKVYAQHNAGGTMIVSGGSANQNQLTLVKIA